MPADQVANDVIVLWGVGVSFGTGFVSITFKPRIELDLTGLNLAEIITALVSNPPIIRSVAITLSGLFFTLAIWSTLKMRGRFLGNLYEAYKLIAKSDPHFNVESGLEGQMMGFFLAMELEKRDFSPNTLMA